MPLANALPMDGGTPIPWAGLVLALAGATGMAMAGTDWWLALAILLLWSGSIWLMRPEPLQQRPSSDGMRLSRDGIRMLIEQFSLPVLMLDRDRIVHANSMAREVLGSHVSGQDARVALRHPEAIALLDRSDGGTTTIKGLTGAGSIWQMTRHPVDERYWLVELRDRSTEADISRAHTDFVANASHELRTPLASIIGYLETLNDAGEGELDKETVARFHGTALSEAQRMRQLVSDLMSLSRIEAEKHEKPSETVELSALVAKTARETGRAVGADGVQITEAVEPIEIRADRQQLEQLVRNLVDNALKYGRSDKPVEVTVEKLDERNAWLTVRDHGDGIAAEHIPHLTRRFYRTDPGRSRAAGGTGLGLAIVKHIVERHRGRLDIASQVGEGTTVTVSLPLGQRE